MRCFSCNAEVALSAGERVGFRDECESCHTDLHACLNCAHYDASAYNECRESSAERVSDRDRANRCEYFAPGDAGTDAGTGGGREVAMDLLEGLFKKS
jgi:hypothetical protein